MLETVFIINLVSKVMSSQETVLFGRARDEMPSFGLTGWLLNPAHVVFGYAIEGERHGLCSGALEAFEKPEQAEGGRE